ncbi:MAG TPA: tRNA preQ1(34) S-adenosylmethionine ribosyltransferase-isomerase QueA [Anaerolineales bacterium]|nr:tRNA preQ1(34) S-adenosylmethionine ribosyltransferase-isomerase QueA [Anaerolineales bacterium]
MKTSDFDYNLPETSIAQTPTEPRDSSRLLVLHRDTGEIEHRIFQDVGDYLRTGDLLVLNQTRVIPARIYARKETGGRVELLLLRRHDELTWEALVGGKGLRIGKKLFVEFDDSSHRSEHGSPTSGRTGAAVRRDSVRKDVGVHAEIIELLHGSERLIKFSEPIEPYFSRVGNVPLPPYIHEKLSDPERYQTVYAREPGSAAAPTAGLHFTPRLLEELQVKGVKVAFVTLHVGLDTFAPVTEDNPEEHVIHTEWCELSQETADLINQTKQMGGRVVAVGTTSVRTLETGKRYSKFDDSSAEYRISPFVGPTSVYILPGYEFQVVDTMITNFHLPKSTLLMLVSAFAGREKILETYETAIREGYRFYSFGDAMLIL